jgi:hypothetical protein
MAQTDTRVQQDDTVEAQGVASLDRGRFRELMRSANFRIEDVYFGDDVQMLRLNPDTAVLAYTVHERLTVDGKSVTLDAADASTWVRGDPFGRPPSEAATGAGRVTP